MNVPAAVVVRRKTEVVSQDDIIAWMEGRVQDKYQLRGGVVFVDALERTNLGKVSRKAIANKIKHLWENQTL